MFLLTFIGALLALSHGATAIEVVSSSSCFSQCGGGNTMTSDLVCDDASYTSAVYGEKMQACLSCESTSLALNGTDSDEYWFMFNMKYTLQFCVIDTSNKIAGVTACAKECQPLQPVLDTLWLAATPHAGQYDYCTINSGAFPAQGPACASCLQSQSGSVILGNFMSTMSSACASKPLAANQQLLALPGPLFESSTIASVPTGTTSSTISSTISSTTATTSGPSPTAAVVAGSVSNASTSTTSADSSPASTTAASQTTSTSSTNTIPLTSPSPSTAPHSLTPTASLALGLILGLVLALFLTAIIFIYTRRRRARLARSHSPPSTAPEVHAVEHPPAQYAYNYSDVKSLGPPAVYEKDSVVRTELDDNNDDAGSAVAEMEGGEVTALPQRRWTRKGRNVVVGELDAEQGRSGGGGGDRRKNGRI